jgi:hypothetical protein
MAQIDLGSIKFNWKGSYSGGTAYVVDDVVESSGSSYICILASTGNTPPNATYWELMSSAGTNGTDGTDLTTTLTTQGDLVYYNGSALARLGAGTAGQALITNGTGANPSWGSVAGGKVLQWTSTYITARYSSSSTSFADFSGLPTFSITPSATSSKIVLISSLTGHCNNWNLLKYQRKIGSGSYANFGLPTTATGSQTNAHFAGFFDTDANIIQSSHWTYLDTPNTTSEVTYKLQGLSYNPTTIYINRTSGDANYTQVGSTTSSVMLLEIGA